MGWIHNRHAQRGGSIGPGGLSERKKGAPLRRIVSHDYSGGSIFAANGVTLECGHEAESWGGVRARCVTCKELGWGVRCEVCHEFHAKDPDDPCRSCRRRGPVSNVLHTCPDCYMPGGK